MASNNMELADLHADTLSEKSAAVPLTLNQYWFPETESQLWANGLIFFLHWNMDDTKSLNLFFLKQINT